MGHRDQDKEKSHTRLQDEPNREAHTHGKVRENVATTKAMGKWGREPRWILQVLVMEFTSQEKCRFASSGRGTNYQAYLMEL